MDMPDAVPLRQTFCDHFVPSDIHRLDGAACVLAEHPLHETCDGIVGGSGILADTLLLGAHGVLRKGSRKRSIEKVDGLQTDRTPASSTI